MRAPSAITPSTLGALASRDFRLLFAGTIAVWVAMPLQFITQVFWVQEAFPEREVLYVGLISASRGLAMLVFGLIGGAFADRYERRRVLIFAQSVGFAVNAAIAAAMIALPTNDASFALILGLTFAAASVIAIDMPARNATLPAVVEERQLASAVSFTMMATQLAFPITLPLAGILNESFPAGNVYAGTLVIWLVILPLIARIQVRSAGDASSAGGVVQNIRAGLRYTRADPLIAAVIALVLTIQVLGMPGPGTLGPVWMTKVLGLSKTEFGWIAMVWGLGTVAASVVFARFPWLAGRGSTLCVATLLFCVSAVVFGHTRWVPLATLVNFSLGVSVATTMLSGTAIAQAAVSDEMRGRVMGLFPLAMGLALLNAAPVSAVAQAVSLEVVVPALAWATLAVTAAVILGRPAARRYRPDRRAHRVPLIEPVPAPQPAGGE